jgi:hypothetical protein
MSEHAVPAAIDNCGHRPGCPHYAKVPEAEPEGTHADLFCACHYNAQPEILANGTDIAWPARWNQKMASEWRSKNDLAYPSWPERDHDSR